MNIIVAGVISLPPFSAGMAWNWMQFVLGLRELGHRVYFVECVRPEWCMDAQGRSAPYADSINRRIFVSLTERFDLSGRVCQIYGDGAFTTGLSYRELVDVSANADLLINMSGHLADERILEGVGRRIYVDQDPVYTQLWRSVYEEDLNLEAHHTFFSVGLNIGSSRTHIPDCGLTWQPLLPPVVLDLWPFELHTASQRFTSVASWTGYKELAHEGSWYGSKNAEFVRYSRLPARTGAAFEVCLKSYRDDDEGIQTLRKDGWIVRDAAHLTSFGGYRRYVGASRAEIGIAKNAYVRGHSGWFSDRSAHYLASGKPVLAQSTGFEWRLPTGRGLLTFSSMDEAVAGVEEINRDYGGHARAAREFAEQYLDHRKVLPDMLERCMAPESWVGSGGP